MIEINFIHILLLLVSDFGVHHPTRYIWARAELIWWQVSDVPKPLYSTAQKAYYALTNGFRDWIGPSAKVTVDQEKGREYGWKDVIVFDENVRSNFQTSIKKAIEETSLIRESIFLLCSNCLIQLQDIPSKGIWITRIDSEYGKNVFRLLIRTHRQGTHNILLNINTELDRDFIEDEVKWLITMGSGFKDNMKFIFDPPLKDYSLNIDSANVSGYFESYTFDVQSGRKRFTYIDDGLLPGENYCYQIKPANSHGQLAGNMVCGANCDNPDSEKEICGVGRLRLDHGFENGLAFWIVGDQLWKGAALNAVQIAEELIERKCLKTL